MWFMKCFFLALAAFFALARLAQATDQAPDKVWEACVRMADRSRTIAECTRFLELDAAGTNPPQRAAAYRTRGYAYALTRDYDRAIKDFDAAIKLDPNNAKVYGLRGTAYASKGDYDRAIKDFDATVKINPNNAKAYGFRGSAYASKGDYDRAIKDFDAAIKLDPFDAKAYGFRGAAYASKGDYDRAIKDCDAAIRLDPKAVVAYRFRGDAYRNKGALDQAVKDYSEAIRLDPNHSDTYRIRGRTLLLKGDVDSAVKDFDEALRLDPNDAAARSARVEAMRMRETKPATHAANRAMEDCVQEADPDRSIRGCTKLLADAAPADKTTRALAYYNRGNVYLRKGDNDRAIKDYGEAIRIVPNYASAYTNRGVAYQQKGDSGRAIKDFDEAIGIDPKKVSAYLNRAWLHETLNRDAKAIEDYKSVLALDDNNIGALDGLKRLDQSPNWEIDFGGEQWEPEAPKHSDKFRMNAYFPRSQGADNWREVIEDTYHWPASGKIAELSKKFVDDMRKKFSTLKYTSIIDNPNELLFEYWQSDPGGYGPDHAIGRWILRPEGFYSLLYTRKGPRMDAETRRKWVERLQRAKLREN